MGESLTLQECENLRHLNGNTTPYQAAVRNVAVGNDVEQHSPEKYCHKRDKKLTKYFTVQFKRFTEAIVSIRQIQQYGNLEKMLLFNRKKENMS